MSEDSPHITNNISPVPALHTSEHALFEIQKSLIRVENNQEKSAIKLDGVVELMKKDVSIVKDELARTKLDLDHHKGNMRMALEKIGVELDKKVVEKEEMDALRKADEINEECGRKNSEAIAKITAIGGVVSVIVIGAFTMLGGWISAVAVHH